MNGHFALSAAAVLLVAGVPRAYPQAEGLARLRLELDRLQTVGSILHVAAHPDDENTALLTYFSQGRHLRTGYLSLTRGEGGQNLTGSEQGAALGVIRTQELLAARRIDGAEQYFTRAIDFGFTKAAEETFAHWDREQVLGDVVWVIRTFRPDVIFLRFSGTPRDGHGQHQASSILAQEAFAAAADPRRFPAQLRQTQVWQARRLLFNQFGFTPEMEKENAKVPNRIEIDTGLYNPLLGRSYAEIAGRSRSRHVSQAMGAPEPRGSRKDYLVVIAGEAASKDPLEGIDTTWKRVPGGEEVQRLLRTAAARLEDARPEAILPTLAEARTRVAAIDHPEARRKLGDLDEVIAGAAGLWADAAAERATVTPGSDLNLDLQTVMRLPAQITFLGASLGTAPGDAGPGWSPAPAPMPLNQALRQRVAWRVPAGQPVSTHYWLRLPRQGDLYQLPDPSWTGRAENPPALEARFRFRTGATEFSLVRPVHYRSVDPARGELVQPLIVAPAVVVNLLSSTVVFGSAEPRAIQVTVRANRDAAQGTVRLEAPTGWGIQPASQPFALAKAGEQATVAFQITPPAASSTAAVRAVATFDGGESALSQQIIRYPHIPQQTVFSEASARLVRADVRVTSRRLGYVMGAGDEVPDALRQLGLEVTPLSDDDLAGADLGRFHAIVTGVRAFNTRPVLRASFERLLEYMRQGGTLVVQYNVVEGFGSLMRAESVSRLGPYPIELGRARVAVEDAPVTVPSWEHPLLRAPNRITEADFQGWVQERGLYFASKFDPQYQSVFASHDPGEPLLPGGMLYAPYGKGAYVFTAYSWFRQLPAGVPGAFRIFANLLSAGSQARP